MIPKKHTEIFSYICHFIFAIIIANSYGIAYNVFFSSNGTFITNSDLVMPTIELIFVYFIIISGWVGYARSMVKWQHKNSKLGATRFILDLMILFCYFGLLSLTNVSDDLTSTNEFKDQFLYWILTIFTLFIVWDIVKFFEHKGKYRICDRLVWSGIKTVSTFILLLIFSLILESSKDFEYGIINEQNTYNLIFISTFIVVIGYRWIKWSNNKRDKLPKQHKV